MSYSARNRRPSSAKGYMSRHSATPRADSFNFSVREQLSLFEKYPPNFFNIDRNRRINRSLRDSKEETAYLESLIKDHEHHQQILTKKEVGKSIYVEDEYNTIQCEEGEVTPKLKLIKNKIKVSKPKKSKRRTSTTQEDINKSIFKGKVIKKVPKLDFRKKIKRGSTAALRRHSAAPILTDLSHSITGRSVNIDDVEGENWNNQKDSFNINATPRNMFTPYQETFGVMTPLENISKSSKPKKRSSLSKKKNTRPRTARTKPNKHLPLRAGSESARPILESNTIVPKKLTIEIASPSFSKGYSDFLNAEPDTFYNTIMKDQAAIALDASGNKDQQLKQLTKFFQKKLRRQYELLHFEMKQQQTKLIEERKDAEVKAEKKVDGIMKKYYSFKSQQAEIEEFVKAHAAYKKKMAALEEDLLQKSKAYLAAVEKCDALQAALEDSEQKMKEVAEQYESRIKDLKEEIEALQTKIKEYEDLGRQLEEALEELDLEKKENVKLQEKLANLRKENRDLSKQLKKAMASKPRTDDALTSNFENLTNTFISSLSDKIGTFEWTRGDIWSGLGKSASIKDDRVLIKPALSNQSKKIIECKLEDDEKEKDSKKSKVPPPTIELVKQRVEKVIKQLHLQSLGVIKLQNRLHNENTKGSFYKTEQQAFIVSCERDLQAFQTFNTKSQLTLNDINEQLQLYPK